jgi:predicted membrane channel-forming protein YqfA (hemolysin III family)
MLSSPILFYLSLIGFFLILGGFCYIIGSLIYQKEDSTIAEDKNNNSFPPPASK